MSVRVRKFTWNTTHDNTVKIRPARVGVVVTDSYGTVYVLEGDRKTVGRTLAYYLAIGFVRGEITVQPARLPVRSVIVPTPDEFAQIVADGLAEMTARDDYLDDTLENGKYGPVQVTK